MESHFFAYINRLNLINRWMLMYNSKPESVAAHTMMTTTIAHCLATIANEVYGKEVNVGHVTECALYHDAGEVLTGDMPTPIKYANPAIMQAYKEVEAQAENRLLSMLPNELQPAYQKCFGYEKEGDVYPYVKAADTLSAYIKCIEECRQGNADFSVALESTLAKLHKMNMPEVEYFLTTFIPSIGLPLDALHTKE